VCPLPEKKQFLEQQVLQLIFIARPCVPLKWKSVRTQKPMCLQVNKKKVQLHTRKGKEGMFGPDHFEPRAQNFHVTVR
jgi:hypothetical protein